MTDRGFEIATGELDEMASVVAYLRRDPAAAPVPRRL
jgi:hypothetical protein